VVTADDERYMRRALFHAARGQGRTTPNPMVGAVVVSAAGIVVGQGFHERAGRPHAEVNALDAAGDAAHGATMYVTLEPCCHVGRTGPCTRRIIDAGIKRVVAAMTDPDARVRGKGFAELRAHGIEVDEGVCTAEAIRLNQAFITVKTLGRPLVMLKAATSLDARVAARPGQRTTISSAQANRKTQILRTAVDAIAVGSETLLIDDPWLTARECHRVRPLVRVVFDRRLRTPPTARLFSTLADGPVIIFTGPGPDGDSPRARALEDAGAVVTNATSIADALHTLLRWDISTLLVEGGPALQQGFVAAELVDRLHLIVAPHVLGDSGIEWLGPDVLAVSSLSRIAAEPRGPDTWIEADVHGHS
jgi:diaminohydroxyphosphoribosylaminopyrimidine deaminase/5-amino-6-(5-phosphoribosylamino)uracil reductase